MDTILIATHYGLIGLGTITGLVVLLAWIKRGRPDPLRGSPLRRNQLTLITIWFCGVMMTLAWWIAPQIAGVLAPTHLEDAALETWTTVVASSLSHVLVSIPCLILAHLVFSNGLRGFGFGRRSIGTELGWAIPGWLIAIAACAAINSVVMQLLDWLRYEMPVHSVLEALRDADLPTALRVIAMIGAFVLAPVGEEILFRGIIQTGIHRALIPRWGSMQHRWAAILATAGFFALMHLSVPHHIPALFLLGVILGYLYERTGSLLVPILVHMLFNGKTLLWFQLELWSKQ